MEQQRVEHLEQEVTTIKSDVASIKTSFVHFSKKIDDVVVAVDKLTNSRNTNWSTLAAWASVILAFVFYHNTLVLGPIDYKLKELDNRIVLTANQLDKHVSKNENENVGIRLAKIEAQIQQFHHEYTTTQ